MSWVSAFLSVIAIIGIIMVGGFVIFFLGDIVLSVLILIMFDLEKVRKIKTPKNNSQVDLTKMLQLKKLTQSKLKKLSTILYIQKKKEEL